MSDVDEKVLIKKAIDKAIGPLAAGTAAFLASNRGLAVAHFTVAAGMVAAGAIATSAFAVARARRMRLAARETLRALAEDKNSVEATRRLLRYASDPKFAEEVFETFTKQVRCPDPRVVPVLAVALADGLSAKSNVPDRVRRNFATMLATLSGDELESLKIFISVARSIPTGLPIIQVTLSGPAETTVRPVGIEASSLSWMMVQVGAEGEGRDVMAGPVQDGGLMIRTLKQYGLATEGAAGYWSAVSGPHVALIDRTTLDYIAGALDDAHALCVEEPTASN